MIRNLLPTVWRRNDSPMRRAEDHPFFTLQREINQIFDDMLGAFDTVPFGGGKNFGAFTPSIDVRDGDKEVSVKAELPGLDEKDIEVTVADDVLTIKGEKREEKEEKGKDYFHKETNYGSFHRVIPLPPGLNADKADARFKKGVLTITLPRLEDAKTKGKKVAITAE